MLLLLVVGRPISTGDLWWHLKLGEEVLEAGFWVAGDPMVHTAGDWEPVQHEWLFSALAHLVDRFFGHLGIRLAHLLSALGIVWLAFAEFRREAKNLSDALLALIAFVLLSWTRLFQARPDLISIACALLLYRWVLDPDRTPGRRAIVASALLLLVWVNAHSLFAIGLALIGVALVGAFLHGRILADIGATTPIPSLRPWLLALGVGFAVTLLNPGGIAQHLAFFTASATTEIWAVHDDWHAFFPFHPGAPFNSLTLPLLTWMVADLVLILFGWALFRGFSRLRAERSAEALNAIHPTYVLLGVVCVGAFLVSFRFLWLGFFPLLLVLRIRGEQPAAGWQAWIAAGVAVGAVALFPGIGDWSRHMSDTPLDATYFSRHANDKRYAGEGVAFLAEAGVEGNLFNNYTVGGYMGYHLAPRVRTFIDGRTDDYPPEVVTEYDVITQAGVAADGRHFLRLLEDRSVDFFFGVGGSGYGYLADDTLHHVESLPGWLLVFRSAGHGIWMRQTERNAANLAKIAAHYRALDIPFDTERGLDPGAVIQHRPDFAVETRLIPADYDRQLAIARTGAPIDRVNGLVWLSRTHSIAGDYEGAAVAAQQALTAAPTSPEVVAELVEVLTALERFEDATRLSIEAQSRGVSSELLADAAGLIEPTRLWRGQVKQWAAELVQ